MIQTLNEAATAACKGKSFADPVLVARTVKTLATGCDEQETVWVFCLDVRHNVISARMIGMGLLNNCQLDVRTVFRQAIVDNAARIILSHTHPSGNPEPSEGDKKVTRALLLAGQTLGVELLDHVIVGVGCDDLKFCSMRERGEIY